MFGLYYSSNLTIFLAYSRLCSYARKRFGSPQGEELSDFVDTTLCFTPDDITQSGDKLENPSGRQRGSDNSFQVNGFLRVVWFLPLRKIRPTALSRMRLYVTWAFCVIEEKQKCAKK